MIKKRMVFVLGAGASIIYGFPIGTRLVTEVLRELTPGGETIRLLQDSGFELDTITEFAGSLLYSGRTSVDAFLEYRDEFLEVGKAAIAAALIRYENPSSLFQLHPENWLHYLYGHMASSFDEFGANKVSFITFNYDRVVEQFLYTALRNSYGKGDEPTLRQLSQIPIIHLHGNLGNLPWQGGNARPFSATLSVEAVRIARENIKVIHETITDVRDKEFTRAIELLGDAEAVFFLGFGYNDLNMERLQIKQLPRPASGTGFGMTGLEREQVTIATESKVSVVELDCIGFLRNAVRWR